ncbi:MAG: alanine racemase [Candidatus Methanomethylicia archaeon]
MLRVVDEYLEMDNVNLYELAKLYDTPLIVFSERRILENLKSVNDLKNIYDKIKIYYAVKACSNVSILKIIREMNIGVEVSSIGELFKTCVAGFKSENIIFNGPAKKLKDIEIAVRLGVKCINVDSMSELIKISHIANKLGKPVDIALRIDVPVKSDGIAIKSTNTKFGFDLKDINDTIDFILGSKYLNLIGLHAHIGSQNTCLDSWVKSAEFLASVYNMIENRGIKLQHVNLGGGLPVDYAHNAQNIPSIFKPSVSDHEIVGLVTNVLRRNIGDIEVYFEPGRRIIANTSLLLSSIEAIKLKNGEKWIIIDAGWNILNSVRVLRWYYEIVPVNKANVKEFSNYRIGGPLCDSNDVFHDIQGESQGNPILPKYRLLPKSLEVGDVIAILDVGAYLLDLMNNFNGYLKPEVLMIKLNRDIVSIKSREKLMDLVMYEVNTKDLKEAYRILETLM